jgi:hypothetical protein
MGRDKEPQSELNVWMELHRDGEVRTLKLEYTVQHDASIQFTDLFLTSSGFL